MRVLTTIFTVGLAFLLIGSATQAAITPDGNYGPGDPSGWTTATSSYVGSGGVGTLTIDGGSVVNSKSSSIGINSGGDGTLMVTGTDSEFNVVDDGTNSSRFIVGRQATGSVTVGTGASLNTNYSIIGDSQNTTTNGNGTVTIDGGTWYDSWSIGIGDNLGTGNMNIQNGGKVTAYAWYAVCDNAGDTGNVTVTGADSQVLGDFMWFGYLGGTATMDVEDSGEVNLKFFGNDWNNTTTTTINLDNGIFTVGSYAGVYNSAPGDVNTVNGTGTINAKAITADRMALNFGSTADFNQTITGLGSDAGVTLNLAFDGTADAMGAGVADKGSMTVSNGVSMDMTISGGAWGSSYFHLGRQSGSDGSGTITGAGSILAADIFRIGHGGEGIMKINDGGLLKAKGSLGTSTAAGGSGSVDMASGGMIALPGDLSANIDTFLAAVGGDANVRWWNDTNGAWEALSTATAGTDYTLEYQTSGDLNTYTLLTVNPAGPDGGDADCNGQVDVSDLGILATNYGDDRGLGWEDGDFNADGVVNVSDLGILATNYGNGTTAQAVPEPSTLSLLLLGAIALVWRRRR